MDGYYDYHPQIQLRCPLVLTGIVTEPARRLGHWLASTEGLPFTDLDRRVEHAAGASLWTLIATEGESRYRALERDAFEAALRAAPAGVIVGGDGLPLDEELRARLVDETRWVALTASPGAVAKEALKNAQPNTGYWHPTRREILMDVGQVEDFHQRRLAASRFAAATLALDDHDARALRRRLHAELPVSNP